MSDQTTQLIEAARKAFIEPFGARIILAPDDGQEVLVDGSASPPSIAIATEGAGKPDCIWRGGNEAMLRVLGGERAFESAYLAGRIRVAGDMSVMARLRLGAD